MSEQELIQQEQPVETSSPEQPPVEDEGQAVIPEKFLNSSKADIIKAYQELEKERGRLASEVGTLRKAREEYEEKLRQLQEKASQFSFQQPQQSLQQPQAQSEPSVDPFSVLEQKFEEDPKEAVKEALKKQQELLTQYTQNLTAQQQAQLAADWYWRQKKENPDYARREPIMAQLAQQFSDIIKPEAANSIKVLQALDLMSKGMDIDYYAKQAIERERSKLSSSKEEKRRAKSESSSGSGSSNDAIDLLKLSDEEFVKTVEKLYSED